MPRMEKLVNHHALKKRKPNKKTVEKKKNKIRNKEKKNERE